MHPRAEEYHGTIPKDYKPKLLPSTTMKITIDTQTDTVDDIRKVFHILNDILQRKGEAVTNASADTSNLMSMFDSSTVEKSVPDTPPDFGSFLNLVNKEETKPKDIPKIEFY